MLILTNLIILNDAPLNSIKLKNKKEIKLIMQKYEYDCERPTFTN